MHITIKATSGSLRFTSSAPMNKDWEERFLSKKNQAKILAWCKDHHVKAYWNDIAKESELIQDLAEANYSSFGLLDKLHTEFIVFVGKLSPDKHCLEKSEVSEYKPFVKDILEHWDGTEDMYSIAGAVIIGISKTDKEYLIGNICESLLKQMFEAWLQVYGK